MRVDTIFFTLPLIQRVSPAYRPDLLHLLEVATPVTVGLKKACTIIVARRNIDLTDPVTCDTCLLGDLYTHLRS